MPIPLSDLNLLQAENPSTAKESSKSTCFHFSRIFSRTKITVVAISDTHNIRMSEIPSLPNGDILIHAGDLTEGQPQQLLERLEELRALPHEFKIIIAGNNDRALDPNCDEREVGKYNDLEARIACRDAFQEAKKDNIYYLNDTFIDIIVKGRKLLVFGSPQTLCSSAAIAFGYQEGSPGPWSHVPLETDILITHSPPRCYLSESSPKYACDELRKRLWDVRPLLHVFGHVHSGRGTRDLYFDEAQMRYEAEEIKKMSEAGLIEEQRVPSSSQIYIPPQLRRRQVLEKRKSAAQAMTSVETAEKVASKSYARYLAEKTRYCMALLTGGPKKTKLVNAAVMDGWGVRDAVVVHI